MMTGTSRQISPAYSTWIPPCIIKYQVSYTGSYWTSVVFSQYRETFDIIFIFFLVQRRISAVRHLLFYKTNMAFVSLCCERNMNNAIYHLISSLGLY